MRYCNLNKESLWKYRHFIWWSLKKWENPGKLSGYLFLLSLNGYLQNRFFKKGFHEFYLHAQSYTGLSLLAFNDHSYEIICLDCWQYLPKCFSDIFNIGNFLTLLISVFLLRLFELIFPRIGLNAFRRIFSVSF